MMVGSSVLEKSVDDDDRLAEDEGLKELVRLVKVWAEKNEVDWMCVLCNCIARGISELPWCEGGDHSPWGER